MDLLIFPSLVTRALSDNRPTLSTCQCVSPPPGSHSGPTGGHMRTCVCVFISWLAESAWHIPGRLSPVTRGVLSLASPPLPAHLLPHQYARGVFGRTPRLPSPPPPPPPSPLLPPPLTRTLQSVWTRRPATNSGGGRFYQLLLCRAGLATGLNQVFKPAEINSIYATGWHKLNFTWLKPVKITGWHKSI